MRANGRTHSNGESATTWSAASDPLAGGSGDGSGGGSVDESPEGSAAGPVEGSVHGSAAGSADAALVEPRKRRRIAVEVWLVLGLSLGQSAVYAIVNLIDKFTRGPIRDQSATLISPQSPRPYLDLTYQLLGIGFALVPVGLALFFLTSSGRNAVAAIGSMAGRRGVTSGSVRAWRR